jgi:hypothetical protein
VRIYNYTDNSVNYAPGAAERMHGDPSVDRINLGKTFPEPDFPALETGRRHFLASG